MTNYCICICVALCVICAIICATIVILNQQNNLVKQTDIAENTNRLINMEKLQQIRGVAATMLDKQKEADEKQQFLSTKIFVDTLEQIYQITK